MTEKELKSYLQLAMKALHLACDELSKAHSLDIRNDNQEMLVYLMDGESGLVNYFLYKAEEQKK